ncbi:hypothetical protein EDD72_11720 [Tepidibacillus fermentans]|uniref:Uncharacterized protein n=1 Tax=Tepidibacillus fermentans TaxID=1281767 RepID=A0A4R3KBM1_9BACI|nr:hypothetical protein EDD72_11720 [Tepidibacillus fermentans]
MRKIFIFSGKAKDLKAAIKAEMEKAAATGNSKTA